MHWIKQGLIFKVENNYEWMQTHAQVPIADKVDGERLRIYFGTRDKINRTMTTFIEVKADDPQNILYVHNKPILPLGKLGCFDDSGVMPSWIINYENRKLFYYLGWNVGTTVRYRLAIGLAVSDDGGFTFKRLYQGPVLDRSPLEPYFVSNPCVLLDNGVWKMWYLSCIKWEMISGLSESYYNIKYAESPDGINWVVAGKASIDLKSPDEGGISRPCVVKENGLYRMWYSFRGARDYRVNRQHSYRIGYAESDDGINWIRKDEMVGIDVSETGWDSEMIAYPYVYKHRGKKYMLYNGNSFGKSGFGYAILDQ